MEAIIVLFVHACNRKKESLSLGNGPVDGLDDTTITLKTRYSISFSGQQQKL